MLEKLKSVGRLAAAAAPAVLRDAAGLAGAGMVAHGAAEIYAPAGWIVGGIMLLAAAWLAARSAR